MMCVDQTSHWSDEGKLQRKGEDTAGYCSLHGFLPFPPPHFFLALDLLFVCVFLFSSKINKEEKLFCSPGWLPLDRADSHGLLGLDKCQTAKLSFIGQLGKN